MDTMTAAPARSRAAPAAQVPPPQRPERRFDRLTRLASAALQAPIAAVSLVDDDRQFSKQADAAAAPWKDRRGSPLTQAICRHVVQTGAPLIVPDARNTPLVLAPAGEETGVGAYLGMPLLDRERAIIGALCIIEHSPRQWTEHDITVLGDVAVLVQREIADRKANESLSSEARNLNAMLNAMPQMLFVTAADGTPEGFNNRWHEFTGTTADDEATADWLTACHPDERAATAAGWAQAREAGTEFLTEIRLRHHTGTYRWAKLGAFPVRGESGEIERWFGSFTDVDDIRAVQDASDEVKKTLARMLIKSLSEQATYASKARFNEIRGLIAAVRQAASLTEP